jgi:hypothetical protein
MHTHCARTYPETLCCSYVHSLLGGGAVDRLRAEQTTLTKVLITWDPPTHPPPRGYQFTRLIDAEGDLTETVLPGTDRSHTLTFNRLVDVSIVIRPISIHYRSIAKSVNIRIRGEMQCKALRKGIAV